MKPFLKFVFIFSSILLVSAILAPILFDFLPYKFERIFNRCVMIFTLAAILAFVRIRKETFVKFGLIWKSDSWPYFSKAFFWTFIVLIATMLIKMKAGYLVWDPPAFGGEFLFEFFERLGAAMLIGIIEEFFFRGYIFLTIKDQFKWKMPVAVTVTSIFYSLLHFIDKRKPLIGPDPTFFDSFKLMGAPFTSLLSWQEIWPAFVGLFIFGLVLNLLVIRTGSLYPAIGMHAGAVFFLKLDGLFVDFLNEGTFFYGSAKVYDGVFGWGAIAILGAILLVCLKPPKEKIQES